jgi:hypothetical protein
MKPIHHININPNSVYLLYAVVQRSNMRVLPSFFQNPQNICFHAVSDKQKIESIENFEYENC